MMEEFIKLCEKGIRYEPNYIYKIQSKFIGACINNDTDEVKRCLSSPFIDVNNYNDGFIQACINGNVEVVKFFLAGGKGSLITPSECISLKRDHYINNHTGDEIANTMSLDGDRYIDVHAHNEYAFKLVCEKGRIEIVKLLLALDGDHYIDVHAENEYAFRIACENGHMEVIKLLLCLSNDRYINVHANVEDVFYHVKCAFEAACFRRNIEVIKLLLSLTGDRYIDIHANNDSAFITACIGGSIDVVNLLLSLKGDRKINVSNFNYSDNSRLFLLKILIKRIINKRKLLSIENNTRKYKRIVLREIKSLPEGHIYSNFPGGSDYLKMLSKY